MYTGNVNQNEVRPLFLISLDTIAANPSVLTAEQLLHCPDDLCIVIFNVRLPPHTINPIHSPNSTSPFPPLSQTATPPPPLLSLPNNNYSEY
jgi:hypothetical protein